VTSHPLAHPKWELPEVGTAGRLTREATMQRVAENLDRVGVPSWSRLSGDRWQELFSAADAAELAQSIFQRFQHDEDRKYFAGCEAALRDAPERYILRSDAQPLMPAQEFAGGAIGDGDNVFESDDVEGTVMVVRHVSEVGDLMSEGVPDGTIGVIDDAGGTMTAPILPDFAGVLCLAGSVRSHLAIIAREFGVPTLMGVRLSRPLRPGERIIVSYSTAAQSVEAYFGEGVKPRAEIRAAEPDA
jgi:phosphohistidine swiveling domain-containing protein